MDTNSSETHLQVDFVHVLGILDKLSHEKNFGLECESTAQNRTQDSFVSYCQNAESLVLWKVELGLLRGFTLPGL